MSADMAQTHSASPPRLRHAMRPHLSFLCCCVAPARGTHRSDRPCPDCLRRSCRRRRRPRQRGPLTAAEHTRGPSGTPVRVAVAAASHDAVGYEAKLLQQRTRTLADVLEAPLP